MWIRFVRPVLVCLTLSTIASPAHGGDFDMSALWPNEDGLGWTYAQRTEDLRGSPTPTDRVVRIVFDGTALAPGGIEVQVLRGELLSGAPAADAGADGVRDPLVRSLLRARPELQAALTASRALAPCPTEHPVGFDALLLGGGLAYRKTASEVSAWRCNVANTRAWTWLVSDLTPGHTFTLQLIPDIASDIFLTGTIAATEDVTVPAGTFASCQRVDYWVDYGLSECTDENGAPLGTFRSATRGSVHYAPGVGPVKSSEVFIQFDAMNGTCVPPAEVGQPASRVSMQLTTLPVSTVASTWGRLKTLYR